MELHISPNSFYIRTKCKADLSLKVAPFGLSHAYLNIFFSETTWLIELKFHMEYALDKTIYCIFVSGYLTKMGTVPIYCKNPLNFLLLNQRTNYAWSVA